MPKMLTPAEHYSGRPDGVVPVNLTLDRDAVDILMRVAPGFKARGRFLSQLLFEFAARQEERDRLRQQLAPVVDDDA